jgi:hypothetical protein
MGDSIALLTFSTTQWRQLSVVEDVNRAIESPMQYPHSLVWMDSFALGLCLWPHRYCDKTASKWRK